MRYALLVVMLCAMLPLPARASASPEAIAVLDREAVWLQARASGDAAKLAKVLAPEFSHVNYRGRTTYRDDEIANVKKAPKYTHATSEQTVDFASPTVAIVGGIDTLSQSGKTVLRLRYTDTYVKRNGTWLAFHAQETAITP
jgi:uncharacterized protein (TIGR02246 family)